MRLRALTIAATVALLAFSGCVSSKKYAALQTEHDTLKRDYNASQVELAETRANRQRALKAFLLRQEPTMKN